MGRAYGDSCVWAAKASAGTTTLATDRGPNRTSKSRSLGIQTSFQICSLGHLSTLDQLLGDLCGHRYSVAMTATGEQGQQRPWSLNAALPQWLVSHPLTASWWWLGAFMALLVAAELFDWSIPVWIALITGATLPSLVAMVIVLLATPRRNLESHGSVFGHFFARYLTVIAGFLAWTASIVLGAAISTTLTLAASGREDEILGTGFSLVLGVILPAVTFLWIVFLLRCAWFLARVRGWKQIPATTTVPARLFLRELRLRAVVIGLAHPGVLIAAACISGLGLLSIELLDLTFLLE